MKETKVKFSLCSRFLHQLDDGSSKGAYPHPWLLVPDIPHASDLLPNHQAGGDLLFLVAGPLYAHVLVVKALWAELVLVGDPAITVHVLPVFLPPPTILAKNNLFWESLSNSMSSDSLAAFSCKVCMFRSWLQYFPLEGRAMGLSPPRHPILHTSPHQQGRSRHCGSSHQTCLAQDLGLFFSFLMEELKVLLVVEKATTGISEDLIQA